MKVLGISGSPRANGNSEILLKYSLKPFYDKKWEAKEYFLSQLSTFESGSHPKPSTNFPSAMHLPDGLLFMEKGRNYF